MWIIKKHLFLSCYFSIEKDYKAMFAAKENYEKVKNDYFDLPKTECIE